MKSRLPLTILIALLGIAITSCKSGPGESSLKHEIALGLEFPDQEQLVAWGVFHGVSVTLEFEDALDPYPVIPRRRPGYESFTFDKNHRIEFRNTVLHVEDVPYPVGSGASLVLFLPRHGDWEFLYRGVPITIKNGGWWKPVILRDQVYEDPIEEGTYETARSARQRARMGDRSGGRFRETWKQVERPLAEEALKVGSHLIVFRPDTPYLEVNEKRVPIDENLKISIDGRGRVTYER